ncbi:unnamed protein product [Somion occarium]|uniref:SAP domain-containing protein n=1 Tax=Somion occarium TaxID=3059160 RepID=A0ABP1CKC0_9APHY
MAAVPDRKTLENMKRVDLQRLCKDHGLRANLKSEALIELLLQATGPRPSQIPKRASSLRVVSRASSVGARPRGNSSSSVIIHDTDDEDNNQDNRSPTDIGTPVEPQPLVATSAIRTTRKAKQTQYRLGVGRPTIAGGTGARAVTRSLSVPKSRSGKLNRSVKPIEEAIQEEEDAPEPGPSGIYHHDSPPVTHATEPSPPTMSSTDTTENLKAYLMTLVNPLRQQISELQIELQYATGRLAGVDGLESKVSVLTNEIDALKGQASRSDQLEAEVVMLKEYIAVLRAANNRTRTESAASGKSRFTDQTVVSPQDQAGPSDVHAYLEQQGLPASLLGKRSRDSKDSELTGIIEAGQEAELTPGQLATRVVRPNKKRAKLGDYGDSTSTVAAAEEEEEEEEEEETTGPAFTVFTGPEEPPESDVEPPPPMMRLSDLVGLSSHTPGSHSISPVATSTANANENQPISNPFNFTFAEAITSTPAPTAFDVSAFNFPQLPLSLPVPTSPTPGGDPDPSSLYERPGGRRPRTGSELYGSLGHGPNNRPRGAAVGNSLGRPPSRAQPPAIAGPSSLGGSDTPVDQCISPAALMRPRTPVLAAIPEDRDNGTANRARRSNLGAGGLPLAMPPETPAPPMRRTMYGTEVEQDTRFGDFGQEGVAMGFWTGAAHF